MRSMSGAIAVLAGVLLMTASALADPPQPVTLNVNAIGAQGVVRINGIPLRYFKEAGPKTTSSAAGTFTDASPTGFMSTTYLLLCTNGDNQVSIEAQTTDPKGEVRMTLVKSMDAPALFDQTLKKAGTLNYTLAQTGLPEWTWVTADKVADGKGELLKTVAAYQQAFVKKDIATIHAFEKSYFDNMMKMMPMPPGELQEGLKEDGKQISAAKLQPMAPADDLQVESYMDGRLYVVLDKNHNAPVILEAPDAPGHPWSMGEYWSRIGGKWYVVKRPE